jgi:hypothetical protein
VLIAGLAVSLLAVGAFLSGSILMAVATPEFLRLYQRV